MHNMCTHTDKYTLWQYLPDCFGFHVDFMVQGYCPHLHLSHVEELKWKNFYPKVLVCVRMY